MAHYNIGVLDFPDWIHDAQYGRHMSEELNSNDQGEEENCAERDMWDPDIVSSSDKNEKEPL